MLKIRTSDGRYYEDPARIHISRNKNTEVFYHLVEHHVPETAEKAAGPKED